MSERSLRRWRRALLWTILAGFAIAIVVSLAGVVLGDDTLPPLGLGIAVLSVVGFFVMGFRRGAPVWIGDRLNSD
jgi:hypothetical protein